MLYFSKGSTNTIIGADELRSALAEALGKLGHRSSVLAVPPDITRFHSRAGELTRYAFDTLGSRLKGILPALGTHVPMTGPEIDTMFGEVPRSLFLTHDWRNGLETLGEVPAAYVREISEGCVDYAWPAQVNRLISHGGFDLILSIGQVVPHEVIGMANYTKNIFVGCGGSLGIGRSHFLGAAYGMERIMGRADNPVRRVLNYAAQHFAAHLPIVYVHTVVGRDSGGKLVVRGLFVGDDDECFLRAAALSLAVNFEMLEKPIRKAVVYLDPSEFRSTWLGNKAIYRTRMALADNAELVVLAPGVSMFGENSGIDGLIRRYGYCGTPRTLELVKKEPELAASLGVAAHLIHGSSEGRFTVTYCPGKLTQKEIEGVGFTYADCSDMMNRYKPSTLKDGYNTMPDGEEIFFVSNPALGLWAEKKRFK